MKLKSIEDSAETISLDTVDDLFKEWQRQEDDAEVVTQILRCLRAALAFNARDEVRHHFARVHAKAFLLHAKEILEQIHPRSEPELVRIRCLLQVLISASAGSRLFRKVLFEEEVVVLDLAFSFLGGDDTKIQRYIATLAKIWRKVGENEPQSFTLTLPVLCGLLDAFLDSRDDSVAVEAMAALRFVINNKISEVLDIFDSLNLRQKCALLDILHEWPSKFGEINVDAVPVITSLFKIQSTSLLTTYKNGITAADPTVTLKLLNLLCSWTTAEDGSTHRKSVQSDTSLLIDAVYLLRMAHELGLEVDSFRPVRKLSEVDGAAIEANPVFGFKRDLVRVIGNMCWRHRKNQDTVREIDGIPLLLDCSPIDANNPIMTQWVIFAIRNLCDRNEENQAVIASIDKKGLTTADLADEFTPFTNQLNARD